MSTQRCENVFGARAAIVIRFDGSIDELAAKLATAFILPAISVQPSEYPPYERIGSAEVLGWELWLERVPNAMPCEYLLSMETEHSLTEVVEGRMHDLSAWLARFVAAMCDVETEPGAQT